MNYYILNIKIYYTVLYDGTTRRLCVCFIEEKNDININVVVARYHIDFPFLENRYQPLRQTAVRCCRFNLTQ